MSEDQKPVQKTQETKPEGKQVETSEPVKEMQKELDKIPLPKVPMFSMRKQLSKVLPLSEGEEQQSQEELIECKQILCQCKAPQFRYLQMFFGCCTAFGGFGLDCGACFGCYGCDRVDCCNVCIGGMAINFTSPCIYGIVAGCCVGCKMMGILK